MLVCHFFFITIIIFVVIFFFIFSRVTGLCIVSLMAWLFEWFEGLKIVKVSIICFMLWFAMRVFCFFVHLVNLLYLVMLRLFFCETWPVLLCSFVIVVLLEIEWNKWNAWNHTQWAGELNETRLKYNGLRYVAFILFSVLYLCFHCFVCLSAVLWVCYIFLVIWTAGKRGESLKLHINQQLKSNEIRYECHCWGELPGQRFGCHVVLCH